jgi:hypothetical protein
MSDMFEGLAKDLELDMNNSIDCMLVMDIVKWQIIEDRALDSLNRANITYNVGLTVDNRTGELSEDIREHPSIRVIQMAQKSRALAMKQLMATREEKSKGNGYGGAGGLMADIMHKIKVAQGARGRTIRNDPSGDYDYSKIIDVEVDIKDGSNRDK